MPTRAIVRVTGRGTAIASRITSQAIHAATETVNGSVASSGRADHDTSAERLHDPDGDGDGDRRTEPVGSGRHLAKLPPVDGTLNGNPAADRIDELQATLDHHAKQYYELDAPRSPTPNGIGSTTARCAGRAIPS